MIMCQLHGVAVSVIVGGGGGGGGGGDREIEGKLIATSL